jgi:hypothetical protein
MKNNTRLGVVVWGRGVVAVLLAGCGGEAPRGEDVLGREQHNQCGGSVERNLANLAAASAEELGRWEATRDLRVDEAGTVVLSPEAESRCGSGCALVRSVLALQDPAAATSEHDPAAFNGALVAGLAKQREAEQELAGMADHELTRVGDEPSQCGQLYWFEAELAGCAVDCRYDRPEGLASKLLFAGYPDNPYLAFESATDFGGRPVSLVGVDPTWYPNPLPPPCSHSCAKYSSSSIVGQCCVCNGAEGTFVQGSVSNIYQCR